MVIIVNVKLHTISCKGDISLAQNNALFAEQRHKTFAAGLLEELK